MLNHKPGTKSSFSRNKLLKTKWKMSPNVLAGKNIGRPFHRTPIFLNGSFVTKLRRFTALKMFFFLAKRPSLSGRPFQSIPSIVDSNGRYFTHSGKWRGVLKNERECFPNCFFFFSERSCYCETHALIRFLFSLWLQIELDQDKSWTRKLGLRLEGLSISQGTKQLQLSPNCLGFMKGHQSSCANLPKGAIYKWWATLKTGLELPVITRHRNYE